MTTQLIRSDSALLSESEKTFPALNVLTVFGTDGSVRMLNRPAPVTTVNAEPCPVYFVQASQAPEATRESFAAFDDLLKELEQDATTATQLQEGRKWVAANFYDERPTLASLRLAAGLSQRQLGEACGMEQPHVSRYESGKHEPSLTVSVSIAKALGVDLDLFAQAWVNTRESLQGGVSK